MRRRSDPSKRRDRKGQASRVCDESGKPKRRGRLGRATADALVGWDKYDKGFVLSSGSPNVHLVRQKNLAFNETFRLDPLVERSKVVLFRVLGYAGDLDRSRQLGFLLLHDDGAVVSHYYTYVAVCFSPPDQIGAKDVQTLYADSDVVFLRVGFDDYFLGWRHPTKEHYQIGSSGAVHRDQEGAWKDGF